LRRATADFQVSPETLRAIYEAAKDLLANLKTLATAISLETDAAPRQHLEKILVKLTDAREKIIVASANAVAQVSTDPWPRLDLEDHAGRNVSGLASSRKSG